MKRLFTLVGLCIAAAVVLRAQLPSSPDGLWQPITGPADRIRAYGVDIGPAVPATLAAFRLQTEQLQQKLSAAKAELTNDSPVMSIPMPDNTYLEFRVQTTEVMPKELADSLQFRTFRGQGVRDPRVTTRFEFGPEGFRAVVFTRAERIFVEPVRRPERAYVAYAAARQLPVAQQANNVNPPRCQVTSADVERGAALLPQPAQRPAGDAPPPDPPGTVLRTYRLAMSATGEYVGFHGGKVDSAARAIGATVQRINEVYESDLAISFRLVAKERDIIFTDAGKDPFTNNDADKLLSENQLLLDDKIGTANYDIGHVLSTGAGGKAAAGVCAAPRKALGATGRDKPIGDPFDIDYVAHEIGHQFNANHTFNSTVGGCGSRNRFPRTAFEPGSGSTVLAYAGICKEADLQPNSHPYFHAGSLAEIRDYIVSGAGNSCGTLTATANTPPVVAVPRAAITIPRGTPFRLTGSASDGEQMTLLYTWEELDLGDPAPPEGDADGKSRPLFRSYMPDLGAVRLLPALDVLQSGKVRTGELLPAAARAMRFRLVARDRVTPAGGFGFADVRVTVTDDGPFTVTKPGAGLTVASGGSLPVAWTVNGTDRGSIACTTVRLGLSLDDGASVAHELTASSANDGAETVTIPAGASAARARVVVECLTQPFFNMSAAFAIKPTQPSSEDRR